MPNSRSKNATDPRVKRTRKLIEQAFVELLAEKGFQSLTIGDIADRATLNRATFYAHFQDKYALLESYVRESFQQCLVATVSTSAEFSEAALHQLAISVFGFLEPMQGPEHCSPSPSERQAVEPMLIPVIHEALYGFLMDFLRYRPSARSREGRPISLETVATVTAWAILGAGMQWARGDRRQPVEQVAGQVVDTLITGLSGVMLMPATGAH